MSHKWFPVLGAFCVLLLCASIVLARGPMVSAKGNKHNLSALAWSAGSPTSNDNPYRAADNSITNPGGQQICIFCHTTHNALSQGPLWNRLDTKQVFVRYTSSTLKIRGNTVAQYGTSWQPNGSSRLCLSCHDGVSSLGGVLRSGQNGDIVMVGSNVISGVASFKPDNNKMKTGHHPVSFVYATNFDYTLQTGDPIGLGGSFRFPKAVSMQTKVKLQDTNRNKFGWMQCTTCHDAHQNMGNDVTTYPPSFTRKITPFWVYSGTSAITSHDDVCTSCHVSLVVPYNVGGSNNPWPSP